MVKVLLIVVQGKPEGKTIPITGEVFRVGRGTDCHLRPNSEEVSRNHAEIRLTETEAIVQDLGSRNGTWINGQLLKGPHRLTSGELLKIGPLTFAVAIQGAPESAAANGGSTPAAAAPAARGTGLDDVPPDQIDAWLVSDQRKPTPDRQSGVYDGDTLTLESYREGKAKGGSSSSIGTRPAEPEPAFARSLEDQLDGIEMLPEGAGDGIAEPEEADEDADEAADAANAQGSDEMEMVDESNPFHAARKAAAAAATGSSSGKTSTETTESKDSSQAAGDILRKMMDRRRGR